MPIDPITGGALIGAGSSLLSNIFRGGQAKKANNRMIEFWKMQNEYNHPRAQMQRLQEAGLNPNLIYGDSVSGATGKADPIGKPEIPTIENPIKDITAFQNLKQSAAQTDLTEQAAIVSRINQSLTREKTYKTEAERHTINQQREIGRELFNSQMEAAKLNVDSLKEKIISQQLENDFKNVTLRERVKQLYNQTRVIESNYQGKQLNNELLKLQRKFLNLGLDRNSPWYAKIFGRLALQTQGQ